MAFTVWLAVLIQWLRRGVLGMGCPWCAHEVLSLIVELGFRFCVGCCAHQVAAPGRPGHGALPGALTGGSAQQFLGSGFEPWGSWQGRSAPTALAPAHEGAVLCDWRFVSQLLLMSLRIVRGAAVVELEAGTGVLDA